MNPLEEAIPQHKSAVRVNPDPLNVSARSILQISPLADFSRSLQNTKRAIL